VQLNQSLALLILLELYLLINQPKKINIKLHAMLFISKRYRNAKNIQGQQYLKISSENKQTLLPNP
jgi:hypothetical protein